MQRKFRAFLVQKPVIFAAALFSVLFGLVLQSSSTRSENGLDAELSVDEVSSQNLKGRYSLFCSGERIDQTLTVLDSHENKKFPLQEFSFEVSPFVPELVACGRWLAEIVGTNEDYFVEHPPSFTPLLSVGGKMQVRLTGNFKEQMHRHCETSPHCSLKVPFSLSWRTLLATARNAKGEYSEKSLNNLCKSFPEETEAHRSPAAINDWLPILKSEASEFGIHPFFSLASEVKKLIAMDQARFIVVSTMHLSAKDLVETNQLLLNHPKVKVLFFFDQKLASQPGKDLFAAIGETKAPNLLLFPVFNTPEFKAYFHMKGAASDTGNFIFGAGNYTSNRQWLYLDMLMSLKDKELAKSFTTTLKAYGRRVCAQSQYLQCTTSLQYPPRSPGQFSVEKALAESCQELMADPSNVQNIAMNETMTKNSSSVQKLTSIDDHNVEAWILAEIDKATRSIYAFTDHLTHPQIIQALARAKKRGLDVIVIKGAPQAVGSVSKFKKYDFVKTLDESVYTLHFHSKAILFDHKKLLFGTANLTLTALQDNNELFLLTEDPLALDMSYKYLRTALAFIEGTVADIKRLPTSHRPSINAAKLVQIPIYTPPETRQEIAAYLKGVSPESEEVFIADERLSACLGKAADLYVYPFSLTLECLQTF